MSEPVEVEHPDLDAEDGFWGMVAWWMRFPSLRDWNNDASAVDRVCGPEYRMALEGRAVS
jgi:hypothetical protein